MNGSTKLKCFHFITKNDMCRWQLYLSCFHSIIFHLINKTKNDRKNDEKSLINLSKCQNTNNGLLHKYVNQMNELKWRIDLINNLFSSNQISCFIKRWENVCINGNQTIDFENSEKKLYLKYWTKVSMNLKWNDLK